MSIRSAGRPQPRFVAAQQSALQNFLKVEFARANFRRHAHVISSPLNREGEQGMEELIIIDQAVSAGVQNIVEGIALGEQINWCRSDRATYGQGVDRIFPVTPDSIEVHQFTHTVYENTRGDDPKASAVFPAILPIITAIPYTIKQMIRIKMNLCVHAQTDNPNAHGMPHVDFTRNKEPFVSAIYYVNDSSGDTIIFNERFGHKGALSVKARITPRKGRLIVFDGALLHAGNTPRDNRPRININFGAFIYEGAQTLRADNAAACKPVGAAG